MALPSFSIVAGGRLRGMAEYNALIDESLILTSRTLGSLLCTFSSALQMGRRQKHQVLALGFAYRIRHYTQVFVRMMFYSEVGSNGLWWA
jgi:hypothetical protein